MHRQYRLVLLALFAFIGVACAGVNTSSPTPGTTPTPQAAASTVIRIEQTGGMLPPWEALRWYPQVALYGDGRLVTEGPQVELYPGPALPNLQETHFSPHGVEQALAWAAESGLQGADRQLGPPILDAGQLVFTVVTDAGTHRTSVSDISFDDPQINALRHFQDVMTGLATWLPDDVASAAAPYQWDRLRVISFPTDPTSLPDPSLATIVDWPLAPLDSYPLAPFASLAYRCFELTGDDLATVRPLFEAANELTAYSSGDVLYQLYLHPLLPDDEACPGF